MGLDRTALNASMRRLADGDRDALGEVYAALWPPVRALCERLLDASAAEDAAQRTLMKLFEEASRYDPKRDVLRWAFALATWECRTERRRVQRQRFTGLENAPESRGERTPEDEIIAQEVIEHVRSLVRRLSARDREVLERVSRGEPLDATLRKRKQRALARLRALWGSLFEEAHDES